MKHADIGLIGLGVMGAALARNIAAHGFFVSVFNRTTEKTDEFVKTFGSANLDGKETLTDLVASLNRPRKIILMVTAGDALDQVIAELIPLLQEGDIIVDGGNSFYRDTIRREVDLKKRRIHFVGCGISGGEYGALHGPSLMVGGSNESYQAMKRIWKKIAAKDFSNQPCVAHFGLNGAGHYVKMVHNGIEYALLQLIAEAYDLLRKVYRLSADQIADIFEDYTKGELSSYLMEIAVQVLKRKDDLAEGYLVDHILDQAEEKGTGRWTVIDALERGVSVPMIAASVLARSMPFPSNRQHMPKKAVLSLAKPLPFSQFRENLKKAFSSAFYLAYQEGFALLKKASIDMDWNLSLSEITRIWQGGCIIRAKMLSSIQTSQQVNPELSELVVLGMKSAVPLPVFSAAIGTSVSWQSEKSPANLIQGMRDYFGSHGYKRTDRDGIFHTQWL